MEYLNIQIMKRKLLFKSMFFLACLFLLHFTSKAQTSTSGWTLLKTQDSVSVYYTLGACNSSDTLIFLRIVNSNSVNKIVSWSLWTGNTVNTFTISTNQERYGSCASGPFLMDVIPSGKTLGDINPNISIQ